MNIDGVRFVNDSALDVVGIRENHAGSFEVLMWDADSADLLTTKRVQVKDLVVAIRSERTRA